MVKAIEHAHNSDRFDNFYYLNYKASGALGAFTAQRLLATIARVTVGQFKEAVKLKKPVVDILLEQDKIRMQHYCSLLHKLLRRVTRA